MSYYETPGNGRKPNISHLIEKYPYRALASKQPTATLFKTRAPNKASFCRNFLGREFNKSLHFPSVAHRDLGHYHTLGVRSKRMIILIIKKIKILSLKELHRTFRYLTQKIKNNNKKVEVNRNIFTEVYHYRPSVREALNMMDLAGVVVMQRLKMVEFCSGFILGYFTLAFRQPRCVIHHLVNHFYY